MPTRKTQALVIKSFDFSETSQVLKLLTRSFGKITALAKGSKRYKNSFDGPFNFLTLYEIIYLDKQSDKLDIVTSANVIDNYKELCKDFSLFAIASYIIEFVVKLTADGQRIPNLFDLVIQSIKELQNCEDKNKLLFTFEARAIKLLGYFPKTEFCCNCETSIVNAGQVFFTAQKGGALCSSCSKKEVFKILTTPEALKQLKDFSDGKGSTNPKFYHNLRQVLNVYTYYLMEETPNSIKFI